MQNVFASRSMRLIARIYRHGTFLLYSGFGEIIQLLVLRRWKAFRRPAQQRRKYVLWMVSHDACVLVWLLAVEVFLYCM